jgi:hypothetical protein
LGIDILLFTLFFYHHKVHTKSSFSMMHNLFFYHLFWLIILKYRCALVMMNTWHTKIRRPLYIPCIQFWVLQIYCDILAPGIGYPSPMLSRINSVLIPTRCIFFFGRLSLKNLQVKRAWLGAIWDGWPTGKFSRVGPRVITSSLMMKLLLHLYYGVPIDKAY